MLLRCRHWNQRFGRIRVIAAVNELSWRSELVNGLGRIVLMSDSGTPNTCTYFNQKGVKQALWR